MVKEFQGIFDVYFIHLFVPILTNCETTNGFRGIHDIFIYQDFVCGRGRGGVEK